MNPGQAISFNGNSLQTSNIVIGQIDGLDDWPTYDGKLYQMSHSNKSAIPFEAWPNKVITLTGKVFGSSLADLDSQLNTFKGYLVTAPSTTANLDIAYNGSTVRFLAKVTRTAIKRPNNLLSASFTIEFTALQPFGQDTTYTTPVNATGRTSNTYTDAITWGGNAPWQLPVITITYTAIGSSPAAGVVIVNNNGNGVGIVVNRTWTTNDVLVIDAINKTVTVNGTPVEFSGGFPEFQPGSGSLYYIDTFTSRTMNYEVQYYKMYL